MNQPEESGSLNLARWRTSGNCGWTGLQYPRKEYESVEDCKISTLSWIRVTYTSEVHQSCISFKNNGHWQTTETKSLLTGFAIMSRIPFVSDPLRDLQILPTGSWISWAWQHRSHATNSHSLSQTDSIVDRGSKLASNYRILIAIRYLLNGVPRSCPRTKRMSDYLEKILQTLLVFHDYVTSCELVNHPRQCLNKRVNNRKLKIQSEQATTIWRFKKMPQHMWQVLEIEFWFKQVEKIGDASDFLNRNFQIQDSMSGHQLTLPPRHFPDRWPPVHDVIRETCFSFFLNVFYRSPTAGNPSSNTPALLSS